MLPILLPRLAMVAVDAASRPVMRRGDRVCTLRRRRPSAETVFVLCAAAHAVASEAADSSQVVLQTARWPNSRPLRVLSSQTRPKPGLAACKVLACQIKTDMQPFENR